MKAQTQTRKTPALVIKTLLHLAEAGARLLIVNSGAFIVNASTHDHWYTNSATFDSLRANEWISAPVAIDANVAEASITEAGRELAQAIENARRGYTQLELEQALEDVQAAQEQLKEESNPMITTFERVAAHLEDVTPEQIGRCHKIYGPDNKAFYAVENERGDCFEGQIIEYAVRYSEERGFTCTCPAGAEGFAHVHHASGVCKHVRWSVAAAIEERGYMSELAAAEEARRQDSEAGTRAHLLTIDGQEASPREYARVMLAQPAQPSEADVQRDLQRYAPRPFQVER